MSLMSSASNSFLFVCSFSFLRRKETLGSAGKYCVGLETVNRPNFYFGLLEGPTASGIKTLRYQTIGLECQQAIGMNEDLLTIIKRRKLKWYGHVSHSSGLAKSNLQGTMKVEEDKADRKRGRKTLSRKD